MDNRWPKVGVFLFCCCAIQPGRAAPAGDRLRIVEANHAPNRKDQMAKPYVVLLLLDGFRADYVSRYRPRNIQSLALRGASAPQGMIPAYPSISTPNYYSIVTGLYPDHHGIVGNSFYDPARKEAFNSADEHKRADGSWYGGVPLWVLAEQQGMKTACIFWHGCEAEILGKRPSYYAPYDSANHDVPDRERIEQVLRFLRLPPETRPHFIAMMYSQTDHAGHDFGPQSSAEAAAVQSVDKLVGSLAADLRTLAIPVNLLVVSDHGMLQVEGDWIDLDQFTDLSGFLTSGAKLYAPTEAMAQKAYKELKGASSRFSVYRAGDLPAYLHSTGNPRNGDPIVLPAGPYMIRAHGGKETGEPPRLTKGAHGYDPFRFTEMRGIFVAAGPDVRKGIHLPPFESVNIFPLITGMLGLNAPVVDGKAGLLNSVLH